MILSPAHISTEHMTRMVEDGVAVFSVEDSDLAWRPTRVYDDACDVGYTLMSHATGKHVVVAEHVPVRDADGDLLYTDYKPVRPNDPKVILRVYND
jgi:hypothetical protein